MSRGRDDRDSGSSLFIGDLGRDASKEEIQKAFGYYGKLRNVWLSRSPWGYGFIDFEDQRDAEDAVKALDGKMLCGSRVRVEFSHGRGRARGRPGRSSSRSPRVRKPFSPSDVCYECGDRGHYAYDCEIRLKRQRQMRSGSRSHSRSHRSRSGGRKHQRKRRRSRSSTRSRSPRPSYSPSRSRSPSRTKNGKHSRSRSR
ncbi:unnamed protein product [Didymodactylos carnosus]|uniref:Serine/arginine-rich splicing factor 7 n=1 Tax=Didymodactylos carnosus TaxID=1234261 RepID=A0A813PUI0_9BILA|nr:unnamed protein product [Didymodactylos carnosus]CAF0973275.1 unnamed protein product [Didymodactylos carnosus]CAF3535895.1 unnamed protein product [Didymodactylos carnosus]CAF3744558.1 unnamed protein product [Didymodactylos carnosus]